VSFVKLVIPRMYLRTLIEKPLSPLIAEILFVTAATNPSAT
jgi:hypothetical protein